MCKEYIIEIGQDDNFPFDGPKKHCAEVIVRKMIKFDNNQHQSILLQKMRLLLSLSTPYLIQIRRILERKNKYISLDYQYVADNLVTNERVIEQSFLSTIKDNLEQFCQSLSQSGIKMELRIENVGVTQAGELKVFVDHNFQILAQNQKQNLKREYQSQLQKMMDTYFNFRNSLRAHSQLSDYSARLDKKITAIQDKINRRKGIKSPNSSIRSAKSNEQTEKKVKKSNIVLQSINSKLSSITSETEDKISHSYIHSQQAAKQSKAHKFSFHDYATSSYKLNQSTNREDSLTKRFYTALEKSKKTFKVYEKYFNRKNRL